MEPTPLVIALSRGAGAPFPELAALYLGEYLAKIRAGVARLNEDQIWHRPHPRANSVGNLLLHLRGNLSLWILQAIGGRRFERRRSEEFSADRTHCGDELLELLTAAVEESARVVGQLGEQELARPLEIQGYPVDVLGAVFHAVEHMGYHTGQILWAVKELTLDDGPFELYPQHGKE